MNTEILSLANDANNAGGFSPEGRVASDKRREILSQLNALIEPVFKKLIERGYLPRDLKE